MTADIQEYYRLINEIDIGTVASDLLGSRIQHESAQSLQCDCPHHQSQSRRSLHVMLDKQGWYCFGCGLGGDVLQLVEFVQSGTVTVGKTGEMPESHRLARDYLAERAGLPPLSRYGLSPERIAKTEKERTFEIRVKDAMTALAEIYHQRLKAAPKTMTWLKSRYALNDETIDNLLIGYADNEPGIIGPMTEGKKFSKRELAATGAFRPTSQDGLTPFFNRRVIFPYWSRGRVVFMIGRKTPWTPDKSWEQAKYKKLPVHDQQQRGYIAKFVNNSVFYNEDCLVGGRPGKVVITEGVTDCLALMQLGLPTISPVTTRFRAADRDRMADKLRGVETVYICQDNELSQAGIKGALQTARVLATQKIDTRLITLPLSDSHAAARQALVDRFGITSQPKPQELTEILSGRPEEEIEEAYDLLAAAKIDVNDYIVGGHGLEDFERLIADAQTPLEYGISQLPVDVSEEERNNLLEPILTDIAWLSALEQKRHLKLVQDHYGKRGLPMAALQEQVRDIKKRLKTQYAKEKRREKYSTDAPPGSCRAVMEQTMIEMDEADSMLDYPRLAELAYDWLADNGARFFRSSAGEPFMFFEDAILWMDSNDRGRKRMYSSTIYRHTHFVHTTSSGRTFYEVLANLAVERGQIRDHSSWLHTDVASQTIYFNLNNEDHEIIRIRPDSIEIIKNGGNEDSILLDSSRKAKPIKFLPDASLEEADKLLIELLTSNMTCPPGDRVFILSWLFCFLLIDFAGTRPMTRFEGPAGSGKTTASKLISTLLYGEPQHKKATDAANYTDGSQNPLIVLDNIEVQQMTEDLTTFMLTSITGIAKEKRKSGTDTETVTERTKCLLNTTGIEPLCGELAEILSRSFVINFDLDTQANDCFLESDVIAAIQQRRDLILSAIIRRTSSVLAMIRDGAQKQVMRLLHQTLPEHGKRRCNDYLSLMYLMMLAGSDSQAVSAGLEKLNSAFVLQLKAIDRTTQEMARESNPIATALGALFNAYHHAREADEGSSIFGGSKAMSYTAFIERYQISFHGDRIRGAKARDLFVTLKRLAKDFGLTFRMNSVQQFSQRFSNDLKSIRDAGFEIRINRKGGGVRTYDISIGIEQTEDNITVLRDARSS